MYRSAGYSGVERYTDNHSAEHWFAKDLAWPWRDDRGREPEDHRRRRLAEPTHPASPRRARDRPLGGRATGHRGRARDAVGGARIDSGRAAPFTVVAQAAGSAHVGVASALPTVPA